MNHKTCLVTLLLKQAVQWNTLQDFLFDNNFESDDLGDLAGGRVDGCLDLALDFLGVPKDTTVEKGCEHGYCRDWCYFIFYVICCKHADYHRYIAIVTDESKVDGLNVYDADAVEARFYSDVQVITE